LHPQGQQGWEKKGILRVPFPQWQSKRKQYWHSNNATAQVSLVVDDQATSKGDGDSGEEDDDKEADDGKEEDDVDVTGNSKT